MRPSLIHGTAGQASSLPQLKVFSYFGRYENVQRSLGRVPVLKKVTTDADRSAVNTHASFLRKPAGLPGGLSLIPAKQ